MFDTAALNLMLDGLGEPFVSAHTAFSRTGASEVAGGSYIRKVGDWAAAAAAARALSSVDNIPIPAATTVRWLGLFTAESAGTFLGMAPKGGTPKKFTVVAGTDIFTTVDDNGVAANHGYVDTDQVVFYGNADTPEPLVEGTIYFVRDKTDTTFKVAATSGGAAIDITDAGSGFVRVSKIIPETFAEAGELDPTAFPLSITGPQL